MNKTTEIFVSRLEQVRKEKGLTQTKLAKIVLLVLGNAIVAHIKLTEIVMWKLRNGFNQKQNRRIICQE